VNKQLLFFIGMLLGFVFLAQDQSGLHAQQDPQYTQYMYNLSVLNPAYAGSKETMNVGLLHRNQWTGFDGAPKTSSLFFHTPWGEKTGIGVSAIVDEIGPVEETNIFADYSYTISIADGHKLAFGLKAGATLHQVGLIDLDLITSGDQAFSSNSSETFLNFGTGVFYYTDNYYLSLSIPNILKGEHLDANGVMYGNEKSHFFIAGGYVYDLNNNVKIKPSFFVKTAFDAPISYDVNLNAKFYNRFELGASYRLDDSFSGLINVDVTPWMQVGFAYDSVVSEINTIAPTSYEAFIIFDIFPQPKALRSPRFF